MRAPKFNVVNKHKTTIKVSLILPDIFDLPCDVMRVTVGKNFQLRKSISLSLRSVSQAEPCVMS
jgi:hypothetical protein